MLSPFMDEFQKIRGVILGKLKEKPFIQDQQCRVGVLLQYISESACVFGRFEVDEQIRHSDVLHSVIVFAGFHSEGTGHVGLSTSGRAGDKDVPVLCDVLTGCQPLNERSVQLAVVPIIDNGPQRGPPYNEFASGLMLKIIIRIASLMTGITLPNYPESCFPKSGQVLPGSP